MLLLVYLAIGLSHPVQAAITKYHRLGALWIAERYCSGFWRLEVQDQCATWSCSGENLLLSYRHWTCFSSCEGRDKGSLLSLFYKGTDLIKGLHPHDLISSQGSHLLIPLPWGLGFQHMNLGRTQAFGPYCELFTIKLCWKNSMLHSFIHLFTWPTYTFSVVYSILEYTPGAGAPPHLHNSFPQK